MAWWKFSSKISNSLARETLAELYGTFILIIFGDGSVAQYVLSGSTLGSFLSINWSWGIAVTMAIYASGGVSGGHINPAVSLTLALMKRLPWKKVPFYMAAQYLGAILASACVYVVYYDALNNFDNGTRTVEGEFATAGIWATYPKPYLSATNGLIDQIVGTALLMACVLAISDKKNMLPHKGLVPVAVGLIVFVIGMTFGLNCGYAINPARDLGPRIFTAMAGWGVAPFSFRNYNWFWVPVVGPHIGAIVGAIVYQFLVGMHWPDDTASNEETEVVTVSKEYKTTDVIHLSTKPIE